MCTSPRRLDFALIAHLHSAQADRALRRSARAPMRLDQTLGALRHDAFAFCGREQPAGVGRSTRRARSRQPCGATRPHGKEPSCRGARCDVEVGRWSRDHRHTTTLQQFGIRVWRVAPVTTTTVFVCGKSRAKHNYTARTPRKQKDETKKPEKQEAPRKPKETQENPRKPKKTQGNPRKSDRNAGFPCVSCVPCVAPQGSSQVETRAGCVGGAV